jgi:predicted Zn-dependent protease
MDANENEILFEQAVSDYRRGSFVSAEEALSRLLERGSHDPAHLSYCGLLSALNGKRDLGVALCEEAVARNGRRASLLYLNLARALDVAGRKREAIEALNRGLLVHPDEPQLRRELQHLVPRGKPLFPSLGRRHVLNRYVGLARSVGGRMWVKVVRRGNPG